MRFGIFLGGPEHIIPEPSGRLRTMTKGRKLLAGFLLPRRGGSLHHVIEQAHTSPTLLSDFLASLAIDGGLHPDKANPLIRLKLGPGILKEADPGIVEQDFGPSRNHNLDVTTSHPNFPCTSPV
jgi:hypothetical protein